MKRRNIDINLLSREMQALGYTVFMSNDIQITNDYIDVSLTDKRLKITSAQRPYFKPVKIKTVYLDTSAVLAFTAIYSDFVKTAELAHPEARATA